MQKNEQGNQTHAFLSLSVLSLGGSPSMQLGSNPHNHTDDAVDW